MRLTSKQREVVQCLRDHPGSLLMRYWQHNWRRADRCAVVVRNDGVYDHLLYVHIQTFRALQRKKLIRHEQGETHNGWSRCWYVLRS